MALEPRVLNFLDYLNTSRQQISPSLFQFVDKCFYKTPVCLYGVEPVVRLYGGSDPPVCHIESSH